jgi:tetratricopeptide (TPR) repeat protein
MLAGTGIEGGMAEGGPFEGVLGDEPEEQDAQPDLGKIDPLAAALAVDASKANPDVAQGVLGYLDDLRELIRLQIKHFDEERRLAIHAAKRKRFSDRVRYTALVGAALVGFGMVVIVGALVWDAAHADGVAVEAFSAPPDLAAKGLTGQVLATELQDQINAMQEDTTSGRGLRRAAHDGAGDIKVDIPETGISQGELRQSLRSWLGHETHVSGEIYQAGGGTGPGTLVLTVRVGDTAGQRWTGTEADLDGLLQSAAEKVYANVAPFRFIDWLEERGRDADAIALLTKLATHGSVAQMSEASFRTAEESQLPLDQRISYAGRSVQLDSRNAEALWGLSSIENAEGHDTAALADLFKAQRLPLPSSLSAAGRTIRVHQMTYAIDRLLGDYQGARNTAAGDAATAQDDAAEWARRASVIELDVRLHDLVEPRQVLQQGYTPDPGFSTASKAQQEARFRYLEHDFDAETGDWSGALASMVQAESLAKPDPQLDLVRYAPSKALALAKLGRQAEADALIATTPTDCYQCLWTRGLVATQKKDWPAADRWFAEAVRQAPAIPLAYYDWGQARLAKGDLAGAVAEFRLANQTGPHWADPLKSWGDLLARQGQWKAALAKYDQALKYAPAWADLHQAREAAAKRAG